MSSINVLGLGAGEAEEKSPKPLAEEQPNAKAAKPPREQLSKARDDVPPKQAKGKSKPDDRQPPPAKQPTPAREEADNLDHESLQNVTVSIRLEKDQLEALANMVAQKLDRNWRQWLKEA